LHGYSFKNSSHLLFGTDGCGFSLIVSTFHILLYTAVNPSQIFPTASFRNQINFQYTFCGGTTFEGDDKRANA